MTEEEKRLKEKDASDDAELSSMMNDVTGTNRKIDDDYDEKMKRLNDKKKLKVEEKDEDDASRKIEMLKERLVNLRSMIGDARRQGKDPLIADLLLRSINAKFKMVEITKAKHDFEVIEDILKKSEDELKETLAETELDVKKEIEERLRAELSKGKEKHDENGSEA